MSYLAITVATLSSFVLGGLWYSPLMFLETWFHEAGPQCEANSKKNIGFTFVFAFFCNLCSVLYLSNMLGPHPPLAEAVHASLRLAFFIVATSFGVTYKFGGRSLTMLAIDALFHIIKFGIYGAILALL